MKKIASFQIDHTKLQRGMYISRIDGDVTTFDIRTRRPNIPPFMENAVMHTVEHLFATFARSSKFAENIIYFGPMGCRTGFYFLTRNLSPKDAIELTVAAFRFISEFSGEIPGAKAAECGNYLEHDLEGAKHEAAEMLKVLQNWSVVDLKYPE